ncbi:Uncharacterised protein [Mycobacteroides abscessus subsp. abscessus]|nr:Uncharacterised protein [Mycobacteroides abscessus subsp. abscessus]
MNRSDAEFMQYLLPPSARGPSSKRWPRWLSAYAERTSVRFIHSDRSVRVETASSLIGRVKLGHPVPLSYLSSELNSGAPETTST